jgi:hypothetical protein
MLDLLARSLHRDLRLSAVLAHGFSAHLNAVGIVNQAVIFCMDVLPAGTLFSLFMEFQMPGDCPAFLRLPVGRLWKTFRFQTERRSGGQQNCSPSDRNRCSTSERNTVRNHNGMAFGFSPESR